MGAVGTMDVAAGRSDDNVLGESVGSPITIDVVVVVMVAFLLIGGAERYKRVYAWR